MKIAILGATSQIAKDLVLSFSKKEKYNFSLFVRKKNIFKIWLENNNLNNSYQVCEYSDFNRHQKYDIIINFVGIGNPKKTQEIGNDIFRITEQYDEMALNYIKQNKKTKYIFLSSGAIYGGNYQKPINENSMAIIDVNNLVATDWYAMSKLYAEAKHRALQELPIVDVRVFNYFSHTQDMNARFLITDIVRALKNKTTFKTSADNIVRDFITPSGFYNLIQSIIEYKPTNLALDCYTKAPIAKMELLLKIKNKFGLDYEVSKSVNIVNATGSKINYYSKNKIAKNLGYIPNKTSLEGILDELMLVC